MDTLIYLLGVFVLFSVCLVALASLVIGLPGTFIIVGAALIYAWLTGFVAVQWSTIGWLVVLALVGEGIEFWASAAAATGERPSRRVGISAIAGAILGGIVGTPFLFGVGALLGALLGAFAGAALAVMTEGGTAHVAFKTGLAALRGRLFGFVFKSAIAAAMVLFLAIAVV